MPNGGEPHSRALGSNPANNEISHNSVRQVARTEDKADGRRMSSILRNGETFHGISVFGRGVFTNNNGSTYAGQHRDGHACGLGVRTYSNKSKVYAEHGPDGQYHGRYLHT